LIQVGELAGIGPYFALCAGRPDPAVGWEPVTGSAVCGLIDGSPVAPPWIAASLLYQGWAARLTSVYVGSLQLAGQAPDLSMSRLHYRKARESPVELLAWPLTAVDADDGWRRLLDDHLEPLAAAIRRHVRIGRHLLLGNVASAMAGSLAALERAGYAQLDELTTRTWAQPRELARSGRWIATPGGLRYARRTCCGYVQLLGGGRCGDCSLNWTGTGTTTGYG
jgi:ferric iron reductase protein FhuF